MAERQYTTTTNIHFAYYAPYYKGDIIRSPQSITHNLYEFLRKRCNTILHPNDESTINVEHGDIFIGGSWLKQKGPIIKEFIGTDTKCALRCVLTPHSSIATLINQKWIRNANIAFIICGKYWYDIARDEIEKHCKPKVVRLDMAVDANHYTFKKTKFNKIGSRGILFVGRIAKSKNIPYLKKIIRLLPDVTFHVIATKTGVFKKFNNVVEHGKHLLTQEWLQFIADNCDIIISPSIRDANPTTLLEGMATGLIPVCTKTSGYYNDPLFTNIPNNNAKKAAEIIREILETPGDVLLQRALHGRKAIKTIYTWERFCDTIWNEIREHVT